MMQNKTWKLQNLNNKGFKNFLGIILKSNSTKFDLFWDHKLI